MRGSRKISCDGLANIKTIVLNFASSCDPFGSAQSASASTRSAEEYKIKAYNNNMTFVRSV